MSDVTWALTYAVVPRGVTLAELDGAVVEATRRWSVPRRQILVEPVRTPEGIHWVCWRSAEDQRRWHASQREQ